ncbi:MAG TPA: transporter substrate-binding domain-containing protein [Pyrinomonadaceae bacterium]
MFVIFSAPSCGNLPRDQHDTLKRIKNDKRIRVGLVENPPWVIRTSGEPAGAEVELVRRFAEEIGAAPEWFWGGEQKHLEALENFELDLVVGGFNDSTPWTKRVGFTSQYFKNRIMVGVPASMPAPKDIKGMQIAVKSGDLIAAYLEKKDAIVIRTDDFSKIQNTPVAASEWELEKLGLTLTDIELHSENRVMATAPGENALIKKLDEFLSAQRAGIKNLLQQQQGEARK